MKQTNFNYLYNYEHEGGTFVPPHKHNIYEMVFYNSGKGSSRTNVGSFSFAPNSCILYAPLIEHDESHDCYTNVDCVGFYSEDNEIPSCAVTDANLCRTLFALKDKLRAELLGRKAHYSDMANLIVSEIALLVRREHNSAQENQPVTCVDYAAKFIDENFYQEVDIKKLASIQGYSYEHFRHLFKSLLGVAPKQYLLRKRLDNAEGLLTQTDISVQDVAAKSGFDNLSMFSFIFKKHFGASPSDYRKNTTK